MSHQTSSERAAGVRSGVSGANSSNSYRQPVITDYLNSITQQQMNSQQQQMNSQPFLSGMVSLASQSVGQQAQHTQQGQRQQGQQQQQISFTLAEQEHSGGSYLFQAGQTMPNQQQQLFSAPKYHPNASYLQGSGFTTLEASQAQVNSLPPVARIVALSNGGASSSSSQVENPQSSGGNLLGGYHQSLPSTSTCSANGSSALSTEGTNLVYQQQQMYNSMEVMPTSTLYAPISYGLGGGGVSSTLSAVKFVKLNSFNELLTLIPARTISKQHLFHSFVS